MPQRLNVQYTNFGNAFMCKQCGQPLLMDGCDNDDCDNFYIKRIKEKSAPQKSAESPTKSPNEQSTPCNHDYILGDEYDKCSKCGDICHHD